MSIDWKSVRRVLVVRLRSIGDSVLATPSLFALKRFLPEADIDILLEDWVAPLLDGSDLVDNVVTVGRRSASRLQTARRLRRRRYDIVFNLHGGTTSTFLTRATGARYRVGYSYYRYAGLYTHLLGSSAEFWGRSPTHSAEQQLALLGHAGVPVEDLPPSRLPVSEAALRSINEKLGDVASENAGTGLAVFHPASAFPTKTWPAENFARVAEMLYGMGMLTVAVAAKDERPILNEMVSAARVPVEIFDDLSLPEITALASKASLFVGNDSGIAHIAAAVHTPAVVIFGSSNRDHWRPWTDSPNEIVYEEFPCQPCPGYECREFGEPRCILSVPVTKVISAIEGVLASDRRA